MADHQQYLKIENYLREVQNKYLYQEIKSPLLANKSLWDQSGHSNKYKDNMFFIENEELAIKPMSCPFHINIFNLNFVYGVFYFNFKIQLYKFCLTTSLYIMYNIMYYYNTEKRNCDSDKQ